MYGDEFETEEDGWLGVWEACQTRHSNRSRTRWALKSSGNVGIRQDAAGILRSKSSKSSRWRKSSVAKRF
jgi:hypothetical protein